MNLRGDTISFSVISDIKILHSVHYWPTDRLIKVQTLNQEQFFFMKASQTDKPTNGPTDRRTDQPTDGHILLEMRGGIQNEAKM